MKPALLLALLVTLGCDRRTSAPPDPPAPTVRQIEPGESKATVRASEPFEIRLGSLRSLGKTFDWREPALTGDAVHYDGRTLLPPPPDQEGNAGTYVYRFRGVRAGTTDVEIIGDPEKKPVRVAISVE